MKKFNILASLLLVLFVFVSCSDDDDPAYTIGTFSKSAEFTDPDGDKSYVLLPEAADNTFEVYKWSSSDYGVKVGHKYTVQIDVAGNEFASPVDLSTTADLQARYTVGEVNSALVVLGGQADQPITIEMRLVTRAYGGEDGIDLLPDFPALYSESIVFVATPYVSVMPTKAPLFIVGGVFSAAADDEYWWKNDVASIGTALQPLYSGNNTIGDGSYVYSGYLQASEFKFITIPGDWGTSLGKADADGQLRQDGGNIVIATAGWYKIEVSTTDLTYTVTPITAPNEESDYSAIGIIGDATPGAWDSQTDMVQLTFNKHIWVLTSVALEGDKEVKFRANNAWDISWGQSDGFPFGKGANDNDPNIKVVNSGNYCVVFNDLTNEFAFILLD